ncbi:MAG: transcription antitermination factor NusB [Bacteroidaceae bacterium]|jgi:N utilization substance protein B|nr:transcription antitermination factor NusB [Bacteroidaceae bacterium]
MINRVLIRLKVIQVIYAYYKNSGKSIKTAEDEVFFSLSKAYDLYKFLLLLIVAVTHYAEDRINFNMKKVRPTEEDLNPNLKFVNNRLMRQLESNETLLKFAEQSKVDWVNYSDFLRRLLDTIIESDIYKEYMASETSSYEEDKELWRKLYKAFIFDNEELDALLEDISLYWNDDKAIVDTFVVKTIKRFKEENGAEQELLPEYKDDEDIEYAHKLFRASIQNAEEYRRLMSDNSKNWDMNRLAFMDVIIMQTAIAEVLTFPQIPVNVSINEYVEIAKYYSTPKSGAFINGLLDSIIKNLKKDNRISK